MYYSSAQNGSRKVIFSAAECNLQRAEDAVIRVILANIRKTPKKTVKASASFTVSVENLADGEGFIQILHLTFRK